MDSQELQRLKNKYDIIGNDAGLNNALEMAVAVAPTDLPVLVSGESGVGKENIPKIIHQHSLRKNNKYFAVNCGAIPEGTIESELFGHEKGSFTGAISERKGYFEEANGGTLFLDEVGELPLPYQAKLLRVIQSGEYTRVGSSRVNKTDVRVIAATNRNLGHAVAQGKFRADLYYRLNGVTIDMPALRDRKSDIYLLFRKFSSDFSEKYGLRRVVLGHEAVELICKYRWPGNIRQLRNMAETVTALESERFVSGQERCEIPAATIAKYLPDEDFNKLPVPVPDQEASHDAVSESDKQAIYKALYYLNARIAELEKTVNSGDYAKSGQPRAITEKVSPGSVNNQNAGWSYPEEDEIDVQEDVESREYNRYESAPEADASLSIKGASEDLIRKALERYHGNRKKAAEELGISERTLYRKLPPEYKNPHK